MGSYIDRVAGDSGSDSDDEAGQQQPHDASQEAAPDPAAAEPADKAKQAPKKRFMDMGAMRKRSALHLQPMLNPRAL